ncbi:Pvc16 family protein [Jatrophihabitans fulvus]
MIPQIDEVLRDIVRGEALNGATDVEVVLDAPTKDWAARRNAPTVNLYLYDIREDLRRRENGFVERMDGNPGARTRHRIPRMFKFSYLVTAWTQRPEDEHRLLASLMRCFLRYDSVPPGLLPVADGEAKLTVGLPPPEDRAFADVWTALGGELKPSLDVVVIAPMDVGVPEEAGPPVSDGMYLDLADTVHGGQDTGRHQHVPVAAGDAAPGSAAPDDRADGLRLGRGSTPRTQRKRG